MNTSWSLRAGFALAVLGLSAAGAGALQAQPACPAGQKPCGPICIPAHETCEVRTLGGPGAPKAGTRPKVTRPWVKGKGGDGPGDATEPGEGEASAEPQATGESTGGVGQAELSGPIPMGESMVPGCAQHAVVDEVSAATVTAALKQAGWSAKAAERQTVEGVEVALIEASQGGARGTAGVFEYPSAGRAALFAQDMISAPNAAAVRSPAGRRVVVFVAEDGGGPWEALSGLKAALACAPK